MTLLESEQVAMQTKENYGTGLTPSTMSWHTASIPRTQASKTTSTVLVSAACIYLILYLLSVNVVAGIYFAPDARLSDFFIRSARGSSGQKKMILAKVACGSIGERDAISHWWPAEKKQAALRQTENRNPPAGHTSATGRNHTEVVVYGNYYAYPEYVITYKLALELPDPYHQGKGYLLRYEDVDPRQVDWQMQAEERATGAEASTNAKKQCGNSRRSAQIGASS